VSPEYTAVTVWLPTVSVDAPLDVANPAESVTGEPNALPSTLNCTVPVGLTPAPVTIAVKLTDCPYVDGFTLEVTAVVELAVVAFTVGVSEVAAE
jgi:hypothetical protein